MRITTTLIHRNDGRPQVVAKGAGKQRTVNYDHGMRHDDNHVAAAASLLRAMGDESVALAVVSIDNGQATHVTASADKHVWIV